MAAGKTEYEMEGQLNWSAHRSRGYGVGSLNQKGGEPDKYWVQPGHALAEKGMAKGKGGRFEVRWEGGREGGREEGREERRISTGCSPSMRWRRRAWPRGRGHV